MKRRGVTLVEMLLVVTILSLMVGISYPSVSAGIETLRIQGAAEDIAGLLNTALNRAERRQHAVEVVISRMHNTVALFGAEPGFEKRAEMPAGVAILGVLPEQPYGDTGLRRFLVVAGGAAPRIGVVLANRRGEKRVVSVDPITGVARVERPSPAGIP